MEKSMEKRTRHGSKKYASYSRMIKGSRTAGHGKGKLISGVQVLIRENPAQLDLSLLRDYEQMFDFKFPSFQLELADFFNDYSLPV